MTSPSSEAEMVQLRKLAEAAAKQRKERLTTVHLLAALCAHEGPAAHLLGTRKLSEAVLLKAARAFDEELPDALALAFTGARDHAHRVAVPSTVAYHSSHQGVRSAAAPPPGGLHLLVELLSNRRYAATRALAQMGMDVARLRMTALQMTTGVLPLPRATSRGDTARAPAAGQLPPPSNGRAPAQAEPTRGRGPFAAPASEGSGTAARASAGPTRRTPSARPSSAVQVPLFPDLAIHGAGPKPPTVRSVSVGPRTTPAAPSTHPTESPDRGDELVSHVAARAGARVRRGTAASGGAAARFALDPEQHPALSALGRNLTQAAASGDLDPVIGRAAEIEQTLDILAKRHANCALLVGPPGVGKTSVARGVAHRFVASAADGRPARLLVELPLGELVAGTGARGALAERASAIRAEVRRAEGRIVLFVDELHDLLSAGATEELVVELKAGLTRGELPLIAATTPGGYRRAIEADGALARGFTPVDIDEPDEEQAFSLLRSVADGLARHHDVRYDDDAISSAITWSTRYLPGRALPDKAVAILDLAGARVGRRVHGGAASEESPEAAPPDSGSAHVDRETVAAIISDQGGVPVERLLQTDRERMLALEELLADRVVGHQDALQRIARVLRRNAAGLRGKRPIGSFLLLGPTGVGKTETAKAIAEALFHSPDALTRLDMSEYSESHAVARLIGAPPGYVGHEAGGELTEAVRRRPYQVVLLDEIEKAHRDVLEAFLQVFDAGRLTDGRGRCVDFDNTVFVLTSNLGAQELCAARSQRRVGFGTSRSTRADAERTRDIAVQAARAALPPELYNRFDEVIVYQALERADIREIASRQLQALAASLADRDIALDVDPAVVEALLESGGFEPELGARPMKRTIARLVEGPLAELLLTGELASGCAAIVDVVRGTIVVQAVHGASASPGPARASA